MTYFFLVVIFVAIAFSSPLLPAFGKETLKEIPSKTVEAKPGSNGSHILEGKLLNIDGEFWVVEDLTNNQRRIHIGPDTTLPQSAKKPGDSFQAVVRKNGHAIFVQ